MLRKILQPSESEVELLKERDRQRRAKRGGEPPGTPTTRNTRSPVSTEQAPRPASRTTPKGPNVSASPDGVDDISTGEGGEDTNTLTSVRQSHQWRRKTVKLLESTTSAEDVEQARRAGHLAAEYYWKMALQQQESSCRFGELWHASCLGDAASVESHMVNDDSESAASHVSKQAQKSVGEKSSERAARRGMRRGKREDNEKKTGGGVGGHLRRGIDGASTVADTTMTSGGSKNSPSNNKPRGGAGGMVKRGSFIFGRKKRGVASASTGSDEDDLEADAWMCGVCGKAFTTLEVAEKHEQDHIQEVVDRLPWMVAAQQQKQRKQQQQQQQQQQSLARQVGLVRSTSLGTGLVFENAVKEEEEEDEIHPADKNGGGILRQTLKTRNSGGRTPQSRWGLGVISEGKRESSEVLLDSFHNSKELSKQRSSGHCMEESLEEEEEEEEENSQMQQQQQQQQLAFSYRENVVEEEKREIEHDGVQESNALVPYRSQRPLLSTNQIQQQPPPSFNLVLDSPMLSYQQQQLSQDNIRATLSTPLNWPGNECMFEPGALVPRLRSEARFYREDLQLEQCRDDSVPRRIDPLLAESSEPHEALLSSTVRDYVILTDEALVSVCDKARKLILSPEEIQAERRLAYLARDKAYYDELARRSAYRKEHKTANRDDTAGVVGKVQNKFLDAYQLMKEGTDKKGFRDEYNARTKKNAGAQDQKLVVHNQKTLYLNVMVQNGIEVVKNELERLAQERWENAEDLHKFTRFERFRVFAHMNIVRFASLALSSDFTPRRIAVQLSNDIYRLLTPRLKRRGVLIETEIEYRVGPYFVLAVNVLRIDWRRLLKATHRDVQIRNERWQKAQEKEEENNKNSSNHSGGGDGGEQQQPSSLQPQKEPSTFVKWKDFITHVFSLTRYDILAQVLYFLHEHTHWIIYQPFCIICYYTFFGSLVRQFILSSVTNEIFYYVEEKGMEMNIAIRTASMQAAFMLSALREIRADSKEKKQKDAPTEVGLLGPLLGPAIPADGAMVPKPAGFEVPEDLEYVGLELDVPVGFRRLRWALLSTESKFITEALYRVEAKYENISMGEWNHHNEYIGSSKKLPDDVKEEDFIGAEKVGSYLMPKSAFVKANVCTETHYIHAYNDYCFTLKKKALTPDVPFGSTFVAWTQFTVFNTGNDSCRLQFSVEPEFPNGPPMVSGQIKSGMRAGVGELFVLIGETIAKYADEYP